jgi:hypothetical protein
VGLSVVVVFGATAILGRRRQRLTTAAWAVRTIGFIRAWRRQPRPIVASALAWSLLVAATVGWDLASFLGQSHLLPTLSYFIGHVTRYRLGRGLLFAVWIGTGMYLMAARRSKSLPR